MPGQLDYYAVLCLPRTATAAEVRRAYREQALKHHPDKNPDRRDEATERFKLIAEAYSVLQDPQQRAAYDAGGKLERSRPSEEHDNDDDVGVSIARAHEMFREVFGDQVAESLAKTAVVVADGIGKVAETAAPHVRAAAEATASGLAKAADRAGKTRVVRDVVAAHLGNLSDAANGVLAERLRDEALCRIQLDESMLSLQKHESAIKAAHAERDRRRPSIWQTAREWMTGDQLARDRAYDRSAANHMRKLERGFLDAQAAHKRAQNQLANAEAMATQAQREELDVQRHGASLAQTASVGAHLLGRLSEKILG